ncbi:excinuclease ABC subunit UvrB [Eubacteriales bacterium OttesenSCG-928-M02]|nr:excinuclease ABC subunit UvrB [Eubacteriales bacterium OttesenSCG-928-M02]
MDGKFVVESEYTPQGDQPQAIESLSRGILNGNAGQVLLGVTGSGKTYTMAKVIEQVQRPALVLAHNKTLAAQLCGEFREFFPNSAVEYFVSYYDYYQPEAYIPSRDIYIEKTAMINDEIDKLRHSATSALKERRDVIIVASVSCIYGLGNPEEYLNMTVSLRPGMEISRDDVVRSLVDIQYNRNDMNFIRGTFRVRGDVLEIFPSNSNEKAIRVEFFGDEIERISEIEVVTGDIINVVGHAAIYPATHYATSKERMDRSLGEIERDLVERVDQLRAEDKLVEAQRLEQRTHYDLEMMREIGFCTGIENYSRYFDGRKIGEPPYTLLDYFPKDFVLFVDESHVTLPQVRAMYKGDYSRKDSLVQYGFRMPSAYDNRPLKFEEFEERINQVVYVSATPGEYEYAHSQNVAEQIIRPTGLVDPPIHIRGVEHQVDDLITEIRATTEKGYRVLVTTLTKRMAERLTDYLEEMDIRVRYMHSDVETMERMEIIRDLRLGEFDVLVGINLLREGLDLPEVGLVAILDADKEGYLRSTTSLIQTVGRAARNVDGRVIMYADRITDSMDRAIKETNRRRELQLAYNEEHGIIPQSVQKSVRDVIEISRSAKEEAAKDVNRLTRAQKDRKILLMEQEMRQAAAELEFERAAKLRDEILILRGEKVEEKKPRRRGGRRR